MPELVFRAVSDPVRRAMLDMLIERPRTASELSQPFAISQPASSRHLKVLRRAGLVRTEVQGRHHLYRLEPSPLRAIFDWAQHYEKFWTDRLIRLGSVLDQIDDS